MWYISLMWDYYCWFGETALKKTDLSNLWKISYFVLFSVSWRPMTLFSYPFLPNSEVCLPRVCTMSSFLSINSSQYHVIVNHVTVFSVFIVKCKVELSDPLRKFWVWVFLGNCQCIEIKLCGISIYLLFEQIYSAEYLFITLQSISPYVYL